MYRKILIFLAICFVSCESKRILAIYPTPSVSHQVVFRPLMIELAKRGHEVTVITPDPAFPKGQAPPNLLEIDLHDLSYGYWKIFMENRAGRTDNIIEHTQATYEAFGELFEEQMKSPEVQALLGNTSIKFDLLFTESIFRPSLGFSHAYKVPVIEFSSFGGQHGGYENIGAVTHPLLYPISAQQRIHNLTFLERVSELFKKFYIDYQYYKLEESETKMLRRVFGSNMPDLNELRRNVKMLFLNVHPLWDLNRPTPPSVIYLGGLHKKPQAELSQDIKSYLDTSNNGVIYVSFGTNMRPSLFPKDKLKVFTKVFSELPYDILWKWDVLDYPDCPKNVKISTWFPQSDLLRHPKIKLFITQAGLQSTDEAITAGVPLIGLPMLWDQWFNVELYEIHDIGIKINFETLTEDKLKNAVYNILGDQRYKNNIKKLRNIIHDQIQSPMERAVWWTEHVLRTGGDHLRTPAANMPLTEYYQLDIILLCAGVAFFSSMLLVLIIRYIYSKIGRIHIKIKTK